VVYFLLRQPVMIRLPTLHDGADGGGPLLSSMPVPGGAGVRAVFSRSADHGRVLPAVRAQRHPGRRPGAAARLQRQLAGQV